MRISNELQIFLFKILIAIISFWASELPDDYFIDLNKKKLNSNLYSGAMTKNKTGWKHQAISYKAYI